VTPREALDAAIVEAQTLFSYIADPPTLDEWDTFIEFQNRGGGDCDGWVLWCLQRAALLCGVTGCWYFVRGTVEQPTGEGVGHAWAEIRLPGERLWADPTWGRPCEPAALWTGRVPAVAYPVDQEIMGEATAYLK
jgi:hypothetical protein